MEHNVVLTMRGITMTFPGVKALDNVDLTLRKGEIMALMGENGAGKSTLIKCLTGINAFDAVSYTHLDVYKRQMHFIPLFIFFPHLTCIDKMRPGVRYVDLSAQMGEQIRWYLSASASSTLPKLV